MFERYHCVLGKAGDSFALDQLSQTLWVRNRKAGQEVEAMNKSNRKISSVAAQQFLEVANTGSVAQASSKLNLSGSAISRQISLLEDLIGVELFYRQPRGMALTEAGEVLADYLRRQRIEEEIVLGTISQLKSAGISGTIKIAASEGLSTSLVGFSIAKFQQIYPEVTFSTDTLPHNEITKAVQLGMVDLGIDFAYSSYGQIDVIERKKVHTRAIMTPGHPLDGSPNLTLEEISKYPVALARTSTTRVLIDHYASLAGVPLNVQFESTSSSCLFTYLMHSSAIGFATEVSAREWLVRGHLVSAPLAGSDGFSRSVEFRILKDRAVPRYMQDFIDLASAAI
jgi:DNA-binding transcriptional LysR family regulator